MSAHDALAGDLLPQRLSDVVPHHQIRLAQQPGDAEAQNVAVNSPVESDCGVAQRAVGDGERDAAYLVVDDLVGGEDAQRVEAGDAFDLEQHPDLVVDEPLTRLLHRLVRGEVQRCDHVAGVGSRDAEQQLIEVDGAPGPIRLPVSNGQQELLWERYGAFRYLDAAGCR